MDEADIRSQMEALRSDVAALRNYIKANDTAIVENDRIQRRERERSLAALEKRIEDLEHNMFGPNRSNGHVFFVRILWDERARSIWLQRVVIAALIGLVLNTFWPGGAP